MSLIVVGFDGSPNSLDALRFAVEEATVHDATLRIVCAWQPPGLWVDPYAIKQQIDSIGRETEERVRAEADRVEAELGRPVERHVECGSSSDILLREAAGADLLVVGMRGRGGFVGLLLGSVASQVAHHAPCPVVIVPRRAAADDLDRS